MDCFATDRSSTSPAINKKVLRVKVRGWRCSPAAHLLCLYQNITRNVTKDHLSEIFSLHGALEKVEAYADKARVVSITVCDALAHGDAVFVRADRVPARLRRRFLRVGGARRDCAQIDGHRPNRWCTRASCAALLTIAAVGNEIAVDFLGADKVKEREKKVGYSCPTCSDVL